MGRKVTHDPLSVEELVDSGDQQDVGGRAVQTGYVGFLAGPPLRLRNNHSMRAATHDIRRPWPESRFDGWDNPNPKINRQRL
jgi:hypothetical protein